MNAPDASALTIALFAAALLTGAAFGAALARTFFASLLFVFVGAASAALAATALGAADAAAGLIVVGAGFGVLALMGATLLTARSAKARPMGGRFVGLGLGVLIAGAIAWAAPEARVAAFEETPDAASALLGLLILAGGLSVYGLLGFGERAAFPERDDEAAP